MHVQAIERPELAPFAMPDRFRVDIAYFMTPTGEHDAPKMREGEYWIHPADVQEWLDSGVVTVVSPLDGLNKLEFEITEEQEAWLRWMSENNIKHVKVAE